ncbi:hypothetical protein ACFFWE_26675 [Sphaerisporangium melleum]|nr:hypothetical protein [Sphaerisporangium melleum]
MGARVTDPRQVATAHRLLTRTRRSIFAILADDLDEVEEERER